MRFFKKAFILLFVSWVLALIGTHANPISHMQDESVLAIKILASSEMKLIYEATNHLTNKALLESELLNRNKVLKTETYKNVFYQIHSSGNSLIAKPSQPFVYKEHLLYRALLFNYSKRGMNNLVYPPIGE